VAAVSAIEVRRIECPHCGGPLDFALRASPGAEGGEGAKAKGESSAKALNVRNETGWEVECSVHGWHRARQFAAQGNKPAVVKCTAKRDDGSFCDARMPLNEALRRTEARDG
jgi:hypothetical protein